MRLNLSRPDSLFKRRQLDTPAVDCCGSDSIFLITREHQNRIMRWRCSCVCPKRNQSTKGEYHEKVTYIDAASLRFRFRPVDQGCERNDKRGAQYSAASNPNWPATPAALGSRSRLRLRQPHRLWPHLHA